MRLQVWTQGWTVTKALDNHTCESHVTGVYKTIYPHMLYSHVLEVITYT